MDRGSGTNSFSLDDVCVLITSQSEQDELGNSVEDSGQGTVAFCIPRPIMSSEYYRAAQQNIRVELLLMVDSESYDGQPSVEYCGQTYSVYRTYPRTDGLIELYLASRIGGEEYVWQN